MRSISNRNLFNSAVVVVLHLATQHKRSRLDAMVPQLFVEYCAKTLVHHYDFLFHCNFVKKLKLLLIYVFYSPAKYTRNTDKQRTFSVFSEGNAFYLFFCIFATLKLSNRRKPQLTFNT